MQNRAVTHLAASMLLFAFSGPTVPMTPAELVRQEYDVDAMHSGVAFASTILGALKVRGRFTDYEASLVYDEQHVERSSVTAIIKAASINTDMAFRDNHLRSPDFFDTKQFPTIEFVSDGVAKSRGGLTISGMLTMHGVTRRVTFPAKIVLAPRARPGQRGSAGFSAELSLSQKEFGIANGNAFNPDYNPLTTMLSDRVEITIDLDAAQEDYSTHKLGTGTPPGAADTVFRVLRAHGAQAAIDAFRTLRTTQPMAFRYTAGQLDVIGHQLAERGELRDAIAILRANADMFGDTPGVLESLGQAQAMANDGPAALATYRAAQQKFPSTASIREMVRHLEAR